MKRWINWNHLTEAGGNYFIHFCVGIREALFLFMVGFASILHAIFPPLFDFKLLELRIKALAKLHDFLPDHPAWKILKDKLNESR